MCRCETARNLVAGYTKRLHAKLTPAGASTSVLEKKMRPSIRYCRGHGWQVLAGVDLSLQVMRECKDCTVTDHGSLPTHPHEEHR
jgi:hypothetical protein